MIPVEPQLPSYPRDPDAAALEEWARQLLLRLRDVLAQHARTINESPASLYEDPMYWID